MTTRVLDCSVTIGGSDVSSYVVSIHKEHFICRPVGTVTVGFDPENAPDFNPGSTVVISEMGTQRFTGYVCDVTKERFPPRYEVLCQDELKKPLEYEFVDVPIVANGETVTYWIEYFLARAGVSSYSVESTSKTVPSGIEFNLESCMDIIKKLCSVVGWQIYADSSGTVHVGDFLTAGAATEISNFTAAMDSDDDSWLRNKVVVFGFNNVVGTHEETIALLGDETRTIVLATPYIPTQQDAQDVADDMAGYFNTPLDTKEITMEGGERATFLLDTLSCTDDYVGTVTGLTTGLESDFNEQGYLVTHFLNERCPGFWGLWEAKNPVYCGLNHTTGGLGLGVWKTTDHLSWSDISYNLSGSELDVNAIALNPFNTNNIWITTRGGVFQTSGSVWNEVTMGNPVNLAGDSPAPTAADLDWLDIGFDLFDSGTVYVLATKASGTARSWLYKSTTSGLTWESLQLRRTN